MKEKFDSKAANLIIETRLGETYATLGIGEPPKKIRKTFGRAARKITREVKAHLKSEAKQEQKRKKAELKAVKSERKKNRTKKEGKE